jgi:outer membrane lipoprotein-sorting protein
MVAALVVSVAAALGASGATMAAEWNVASLMQGLAQQKGGKVAFVERKYLAILDRPVESTGELVYRPPLRLEKRTLTPRAEVLVLDGDELVVERGKQRFAMRLQQYPEIGAIVDSIRATLGGDLGALERQYRVTLDGSPERWVLVLLPSDAQVAAIVLRIRISGVRSEVRQIELLQADGDRSVMDILAPAR